MSTLWHTRWAEGRTGFHMGRPHTHLADYGERWLGPGPHGIFVPLAGKTHDIPWLLRHGHRVVAVELVPKAVEDFHAEQGIAAVKRPWGAFTAWESPGLTFLQGDVLELQAEHLHGVDRVWDRAALIALPPEVRQAYVALQRRLLPPGTRTLLRTLTYDPAIMGGPPFTVPPEEVRRLYAGAPLLEELQSDDALTETKWREAGHEWMTGRTWLVEI